MIGFLSLTALRCFKSESIKYCLVHNYGLKWAQYFSGYCNIEEIWINQEIATLKYFQYYYNTVFTYSKLPTASSPSLG